MTPVGHAILYSAFALFALTVLGNLAYRAFSIATGLAVQTPPDTDTPRRTGRIIGWLERLVLAAGLLANSWHVIAAVIALKSVSRFKELDDKTFAEYFQIGSLFSLFWALLVTAAWLVYDQSYGNDLYGQLQAFVGP